MQVNACVCVGGGVYLSRREDGMNASLGEGLTKIRHLIYTSSSSVSGSSDIAFPTRLHATRSWS